MCIQTPAESVAAILDTGVKAMPGDVDGLMKELRMARREADLSRGRRPRIHEAKCLPNGIIPNFLALMLEGMWTVRRFIRLAIRTAG